MAITLLAVLTIFVFWCRSALKNQWFQLFISLWSVLLYPCFINSYTSMQEIITFAMEKSQTSPWINRLFLFILHVKQTQHPSWRDFCTSNFSCKMGNTVLYSITGASTISQHLIFWSLNHIVDFVFFLSIVSLDILNDVHHLWTCGHI